MMTAVLLLIWGTLEPSQKRQILVRILEEESKKPTNTVSRELVAVVEAALNNQLPDDELIDRLVEATTHG